MKNGRIPSLNGWRAIAISIVIICHFVLSKNFPKDRFPIWTFFAFDQARLGVRIFFVISGFLITHLLLKEGEEKPSISLKHFYLRRCIRILPVYFFYLAVLGSLTLLGVYHDTPSSWMGALTFTRNMIGQGGCTAHFWSLAIEEQFYLMWPLLIALLLLWRRFQTAFTLLMIPMFLCPLERLMGFTIEKDGAFVGRVFGEWSIFAYADSLAAGCLGAFLIRRVRFRMRSLQSSFGMIAALSTIFIGAVWNYAGGNMIVSPFIPTIQAIAIMTAMWISIFHEKGLMYRILNWPPIDWLGVISYSLYIWQQLFTAVSAGPILGRLFIYDWHIWWLAALVMAVFSYYCLEIPMLRLKKRFAE